MSAYGTPGQSNPAATTNTSLYTVPAGTGMVAASLIVTNQSATVSATFRVAVRVGGATLNAAQYVRYEKLLTPCGGPSGSDYTDTIGLSLSPGDVVTVYASTANVSFNLTGVVNP